MKRPAGILAVIVVVLVAASPVLAAGQFDGIWSGHLSNPEFCPEPGDCPYFFSIHQNDAFLQTNGFNTVVVLLDAFGIWCFVLGTLSGSTLQGTAFDSDFQPIGTFSMTVSGTMLSGQTQMYGTPYSVTATKLF